MKKISGLKQLMERLHDIIRKPKETYRKHKGLFTAIMIFAAALIFLFSGYLICIISGQTSAVDIIDKSTEDAWNGNSESDDNFTSVEKGVNSSPVVYKHLSKIINNKKQKINIIEVDVSNPDITILPVLSSELVYGFELLSSMAARKNAYAAINGGFFSQYGFPSGMVVTDGKPITLSSGKYPVFQITKGKASFSLIKSEAWFTGNNSRIRINGMNIAGAKSQSIVYTSAYGFSNRARVPNITFEISNNLITKIISTKGETKIPEGGFIVTLYDVEKYNMHNLPFSIGDKAELLIDPLISDDLQAYECGSWLVKDGRAVIGDSDSWVGVLTNNDPRTAVGIMKDGKVMLITVDGRQPGHSSGMTGKELAAFMLEYGAENAAMLDGGASTEIIIDGKIVNKPSFKGQERPLGGGILVIWDTGTGTLSH